MSAYKTELGDLGRAVADNIERLRILNGMSYRALAAEVRKYARPITHTALCNIAAYKRQVPVDDLAAIAAALNTTPAKLLDSDVAERHREACLRWLVAEMDFKKGVRPISTISIMPNIGIQPNIYGTSGISSATA